MNFSVSNQPVNVVVSLAPNTPTTYSFYTPAFIVESNITDRDIIVKSADDLLNYGFTSDDSAYTYCLLAFQQTPDRVEQVVIVSKKSSESYLEAFVDSDHSQYYFISLDSENVEDVLEISDYLLQANIRKLLFISMYEDISEQVKGRSNIVWWYTSDFWFWDSSAMVVWDNGFDLDLSAKQYPESAWISRCGNLFPSHVQWSYKELVGLTPEGLDIKPEELLDYGWQIRDQDEIAWDSSKNVAIQNPLHYEDNDRQQHPFSGYYNWFDTVMDSGVSYGSGMTCDGEWIDSRVFEDWMVWAIQRNVWKLLKLSPKISSTRDGLEKIQLKIQEVLDFGVEQNGIINYTIKEAVVDKLTRNASFKFNYTRQHAIIGVISINGTVST